jgi:hypothetical protein
MPNDMETKFYKELIEEGVECRIIGTNSKIETKFLPVQDLKLHVAVLKNIYGEIVDERPFIDYGYLRDHEKGLAFVARGIPPLTYKINEVMPQTYEEETNED